MRSRAAGHLIPPGTALTAEDDDDMNVSVGPMSAWLLLTFGDERQYAGNLGYKDDPARVYRYDSFVPNSRLTA